MTIDARTQRTERDTTGTTYLTTADALEYLRTSPRTLYRHLAAGDIPGVRVGHQWRFRKSDLDNWLTRRSATAVAPGNEAAPTTKPEAAKTPRVLVVDDEPSICELVSTILAVAALDVETAFNGFTAMDRLRTRSYDLMLTDLKMPGMEGTELARAAKRLHPAIKVLIVTGFPSQSSAIDAVNIGVDGYLTKPFHPMDVLMATARALNLGPMQGNTWAESVTR